MRDIITAIFVCLNVFIGLSISLALFFEKVEITFLKKYVAICFLFVIINFFYNIINRND
jgi:hypothetical protein